LVKITHEFSFNFPLLTGFQVGFKSTLMNSAELNSTTWQRLENYQGPAIQTKKPTSIFRQLRSLLGGPRRNISRFRASCPRKNRWQDHLRKSA